MLLGGAKKEGRLRFSDKIKHFEYIDHYLVAFGLVSEVYFSGGLCKADKWFICNYGWNEVFYLLLFLVFDFLGHWLLSNFLAVFSSRQLITTK